MSREPSTEAGRRLAEITGFERLIADVEAEAALLARPVEPWTADQHREDAKLVQSAMQRLAQRRSRDRVYVPIEDASDLLMALHRDGIYRPSADSVWSEPLPPDPALLARRAPGDRGEPLDVERLAHAMYADGCIRPPLTDHAKHVLVALRALRADSRPEQPR